MSPAQVLIENNQETSLIPVWQIEQKKKNPGYHNDELKFIKVIIKPMQ